LGGRLRGEAKVKSGGGCGCETALIVLITFKRTQRLSFVQKCFKNGLVGEIVSTPGEIKQILTEKKGKFIVDGPC